MKLSRRLFLKRAALAGGTLATASALPPVVSVLSPQAEEALNRRAAGEVAATGAQEVVTFFDGQLWLDTSGASRAYRAPVGAPLAAHLTDAELHCLYGRI